MSRSSAAAGLFAAFAVTAASLLGASPAHAAALPATGSSAVDFVPIAIGAVLLLLAGVAIAVTHRITHRRHHHSAR